MVIFLNEDRAYLYWVTHHRDGFVLDGRHSPKLTQPVLHRTSCPAIRKSESQRAHWTTGKKLKACSLKSEELLAWVEEQGAPVPANCEFCRPQTVSESDSRTHTPSKLARDILDFVLEAALIHMDEDSPKYQLTVADIAACFGKTSGQIRAALRKLMDDELLATAEGQREKLSRLRPDEVIYPTARAIRTLDAFQQESEAAIMAELSKLHLEL